MKAPPWQAVMQPIFKCRLAWLENGMAAIAVVPSSFVKTAQQAASRLYPGVTFQVLFWDYDDDDVVGARVLSQLKVEGLIVHPVSTILPGFPAARTRYEISPYDRHPNAQAHARIADFVARHLR